MILLDTDLIIIDRSHQRDPRRPTNRKVLDLLASNPEPIGMTVQAVLEVTGKLSYGTPAEDIPGLPLTLITDYGIRIIPDPGRFPDYAGCQFAEILIQMTRKMSLGDAVQAIQIAKYAPDATLLLTWNAKHFVGNIVIPVQSPADWLATRGGTP